MRITVKSCRDTLSEIKHVAELANIEYLRADWSVTISELVIRTNSISHLASLEYNNSCIYTGTTRGLQSPSKIVRHNTMHLIDNLPPAL